MKHFLIKYRFKDGSEAAWREQIGRFIAAVEADATLNGRISYRCMKADNGSGEYYHLAATADDEAGKALQSRDFFKAYTEETRRVSGGTVEVLPLAIVAETSARASFHALMSLLFLDQRTDQIRRAIRTPLRPDIISLFA